MFIGASRNSVLLLGCTAWCCHHSDLLVILAKGVDLIEYLQLEVAFCRRVSSIFLYVWMGNKFSF
jgi:hypothetical protein